MGNIEPLVCHVRRHRKQLGLSATEVARLAGISRQALHRIEVGATTPSTAIALRVAAALNCTVEDLFGLSAECVRPIGAPVAPDQRVLLGHVDDQWVSHPLPALDARAADGLTRGDGGVECLESIARLERQALVTGCAPFLALLESQRSDRHSPGVRVLSNSSLEALDALASNRVHAAGLHMADRDDPKTHRALVRAHLPNTPCIIVQVVMWRQGLAMRRDAHAPVRTVGDLSNPRAKIVRRASGAGSTRVLRHVLAQQGLSEDEICGPRLNTHREAAHAVAMGAADTAVVVEPVAQALNLDFHPLSEERFELIIRARDLSHAGVISVMEHLNSSRFMREITALGPYDTSNMGAHTAVGLR